MMSSSFHWFSIYFEIKQTSRGVLRKRFLKICSKLTGEHQCWSVISITLHSNFIETTLRHGCSPVYLLHIFRTPFRTNTSGRLLLFEIAIKRFVVRMFSLSRQNFVQNNKKYHQKLNHIKGNQRSQRSLWKLYIRPYFRKES